MVTDVERSGVAAAIRDHFVDFAQFVEEDVTIHQSEFSVVLFKAMLQLTLPSKSLIPAWIDVTTEDFGPFCLRLVGSLLLGGVSAYSPAPMNNLAFAG